MFSVRGFSNARLCFQFICGNVTSVLFFNNCIFICVRQELVCTFSIYIVSDRKFSCEHLGGRRSVQCFSRSFSFMSNAQIKLETVWFCAVVTLSVFAEFDVHPPEYSRSRGFLFEFSIVIFILCSYFIEK